MFITKEQENDTRELAFKFPDVLEKAVSDWAKFKTGRELGLFNASQIDTIVDWFAEFPKLWNGIRPHYVAMSSIYKGDRLVDQERPTELARVADNFSRKLGGAIKMTQNALGFVVTTVIAGIAILAAFGVVGVTWGVGYIKKQNNISSIIDQVTTGKIPAEVLKMAIDQEEKSLIGEAGDLLKYGAIAALIVLGFPLINRFVK